jgi:hypothetical protein
MCSNGTSWNAIDGTSMLTVTQPQFDNDTSVATTQFVQRALGNFSGFLNIAITTTLTASQVGNMIVDTGASTTFTLPLSSTVPRGSVLQFVNHQPTLANTTIAAQGADVLILGVASVPTITIPSAGTGTFVAGTGNWNLVGGSVASQLAISTPPQFDSDTSIATTRFVQRALGSFSGVTSSGTRTLTASDIGQLYYPTAGSTLTFPKAATVAVGSVLSFWNPNPTTASLAVQAGDSQQAANNALKLNPMALEQGETADFVSDGNASWILVGGSKSLVQATSFSALKSTQGWQKLPSGIIMQWGNGTTSAAGTLDIVYPIKFPLGYGPMMITPATSGPPISVSVSASSLVGVTVNSWVSNTAAPNTTVFTWLVYGW